MRKFSRIFVLICIMVMILSSCNLPSSVTPVVEELEEVDYQATIDAGVRMTEDALADVEPSATFTVQALSTDTPEPVIETPEPEADTPEPTVEIVHLMVPGEPGSIKTWVSDVSSEAYAPENRAIGDSFAINILERPFTADDMQYQPYLDITKAEVSVVDGAWIYINIQLVDVPPQDIIAVYAFEADANQDGRGDIYIGAQLPNGTEWTTDGAFVYADLNDDVGGEKPVSAEVPYDGWDGYETMMFDSGVGDDPDMVWIRRDPSNPTRVQLAFKNYLVDADGQFLWGVWADAGQMDPGSLDYNDHFTIENAGSPSISSSNYPLKDLASVDNSCRWTYGFEPTGPIPGLCPLPATPTPEPTITPTPTQGLGSILVFVYEERSTPYGSFNGTDVPMENVTVNLGQGACPSSGYLTDTTTMGVADFLSLPAGTYCVDVQLAENCGNWVDHGGDPFTVTVTAGNESYIYSGWAVNLCSQ